MVSDGPIIINGPFSEPALCWLRDYTGQRFVALRSIEGPAVLEFIDAVVGPRPSMPELGPGGEMVIDDAAGSKMSNGIGGTITVPHWTYNPSGDNLNTVKAQLYATQVQAWQDHYKLVVEMVRTFLLQHAAKAQRAPAAVDVEGD